MNSYVVIDIEATGNVNVANTRIIDIALVIIENDEITFEFSTLINPQITIPPYITSLTGITDDDVKNAPLFSEVAEELKSIIGNRYIVGHGVLFDVRFLNKEFNMLGFNQLTNKTIDTVELSKILFPTISKYKLSELSKYFNLEHHSPHRALSDTIVTGHLFLKLKEKLFNLPLNTKQQLKSLLHLFHSDLEEMLYEANRQYRVESDFISFNGITFKNIFQQLVSNQAKIDVSYGQLIDAMYDHNGILKNKFANYEFRNSQQNISELIYDAFREKRHALIEAATGTGKTMAYLIPALYVAVKNNESVVISTEKINLQLQLIEDELPKLKKIMPFSFNYTSLKGKSHYLNLNMFSKQLKVKENNYNKNLLKAMILVWITETDTGDLNELNLPEGTVDYVKNMSAVKEKSNSPWAQYSYYKNAFKKAENAHIVIVNHSLLSADLHLQNNLIPPYDKIIIDEAHNFTDVAKEQFSLTIDYDYVLHVIKKLKVVANYNSHCKKLYSTLNNVLNEFSHYIIHLLFDDHDEEEAVIINEHHKMTWEIIVDMVNRIVYSLEQLINYIKEKFANTNNIDINSLVNIKEQFYQMTNIHLVNHCIVSFAKRKYGERTDIIINIHEQNIASKLAKKLFNEKGSVILTSGTLTVNDSYNYFIDYFGLNEFNIMKQTFNSPFNLNKQVQVMIPNDFPPVSDDDFLYVASEAILSLAHILKGNILILFTSHKMLKSVYYLLDEVIGLQYNLIAQNITHRNNYDLINEFKKGHNNILLGTNSMWEGIDIPGDHLTGLIIVKLPFENPNDIHYKVKQKVLEEQGVNHFYHYMLPRMIIRLKQGMGRLIRTKTDKGVIFILDNRLCTASYSDYITTSIKQYPMTYDSTNMLMDKTKKWFQ